MMCKLQFSIAYQIVSRAEDGYIWKVSGDKGWKAAAYGR